ncbi:class I SAM-dependent methyltransferase [Amycolatopsis acidicola]|uniref:Class I SAM-dependent methyltransferase n=1 Tax=Amycolatopsis acidicola TaxID=2596893 RepID=A0A5N0UQ35_9PSEU|nr:class I SAM-dependent methyltransferase [Amycolatopsis acidicola]KAA9150523.1 class I SAM-dependent methyltransferase [Amycolatopsis acidicola]
MPSCRACGSTAGDLVLDLGEQPPCDLFPAAADPGPDPLFPLRMWLCGQCSLAQLLEDPGTREEPAGVEPKALTDQAAHAVRVLRDAGVVRPGATVIEFGSPHGGSWLPLLRAEGMVDAAPGEPADVVLDCFGLMHEADQRAAMAGRAERLAPGGVLLMQYHSLASILAGKQWNALRHGHFAYYSTPAAITLAASAGLRPGRSWTFPLYGGTVLLELGRDLTPAQATEERVRAERAAGVADAAVVGGLGREAEAGGARLRELLTDRAKAGKRVIGYGAASRAVVLLWSAEIDIDLLPVIVDASPAKQGRRMPATRIPVETPRLLAGSPPDAVLLFVPDLLPEVRAAHPALGRPGCEWITV